MGPIGLLLGDWHLFWECISIKEILSTHFRGVGRCYWYGMRLSFAIKVHAPVRCPTKTYVCVANVVPVTSILPYLHGAVQNTWHITVE
jgi:hypothetical protein